MARLLKIVQLFQKIIESSINDGDEKFHEECFLCDYEDKKFQCSKQLKNLEFHRKNGSRYCTNCYSEFIAESCNNCKERIIGLTFFEDPKILNTCVYLSDNYRHANDENAG